MKSVNVSFKEEQYIDQWWLRLILLVVLGVVSYAVYRFLEKGADAMEHLAFWPGIVIGLAVVPIIWFWKLSTKIDNYGITVKCPFVKK